MAERILIEFPASSFFPAADAELVAGDVFAPIIPVGGRLVAAFDDTIEEAVVTPEVQMPAVAGTLKARLSFFSASANSNEVNFEIYVEAKTENTDTLDMETTSSWSTLNDLVHTFGGTAGDPRSELITLTNDDGAAEGDSVRFGIRRDADDGTNDDATGDIYITKLTILDET